MGHYLIGVELDGAPIQWRPETGEIVSIYEHEIGEELRRLRTTEASCETFEHLEWWIRESQSSLDWIHPRFRWLETQ